MPISDETIRALVDDKYIIQFRQNALSPDRPVVSTLSGGSFGFNAPEAIAFDGAHIWVTNYAGNSVSELAGG